MRERSSGVRANWGDAYQTTDVRADEGFGLDRATDRLQRDGVSDRDLRVGSAEACAEEPGATTTTSCDPSFVNAMRMGGSVDGRLGQLLTRSRVDEANDVVTADREGSPVRAVRKAPPPESFSGSGSPICA